MLFPQEYDDFWHMDKFPCISVMIYPKISYFHEFTEIVILLICKNWFLVFMNTSKINLHFHKIIKPGWMTSTAVEKNKIITSEN